MLSDFTSLTATSRATRGSMAAAQAEMDAKLAWMKEDMQVWGGGAGLPYRRCL
jgi:hypothetical protein